MSKTSILVVEDELIVARDIRARLLRQGYAVPAVVSSGEEAIREAAVHRPDLILMDIMLKGEMDGIEAAERIGAQSDVPIIYLTAFADERTLQRAKITEPFGYILKPFEERELHITIEMALYKHGVEQVLREKEQWFATTLWSIGDAVISTDREDFVTFMNPMAENLTGWSRKDALGRRLNEVFVKDVEKSVLISRDGRRIPLQETSSPLQNGRGETRGSVHVFRDVSEQRKAEQALLDSMERYRSLYENAPVMLHSIDKDRTILSVSDYWLEVMGYERDEVLGRDSTDFLTDHSRKFMVDVVLPQAIKTGSCKDIPLRYVKRDENGIDVLLSVVGEQEPPGEATRLMVVSVDVTERRRAEEQIRFQASLLAQVHNAVVATDRSRGIIFWNDFAETLYQWKSEEVQGRNIVDVLLHHEGREKAERIFSEAEREGQWEGELVAVRKDGTPIPVFLTDSPIRDAAGGVIGFVGVSVDVTERRRAEEALQDSEEQYRKFFEDDLTGDYIAKPDGTLISCNQAFMRIFGFSSLEDALSYNVAGLYHSREEAEDFIARLQENRKLEYFEKDLVRKDGGHVRVVENAIGTFDERGMLVEYKGYVFDDTERKRLEDQLRQAQKMESIGTLASGIAHDFNNILNNVLGFAVQVQKHCSDPARVQKYGKTIEKSATRGAELSAQLLSFARVSKREKVPINVADVVNEVVSLCAETFPRSIEIRKTIKDDSLHVQGDHTELYQVLLNLCVNARDAIIERHDGAHGLLTVEVRTARTGSVGAPGIVECDSDRCVEIRVQDNGTGIPGAIRDRIFDPFFTTKEKGKGTGLGLAMVYSVIRNHRGTLFVDSDDGKGTTFTLHLPVVDPQEKVETPSPIQDVRARGAERILVVDDEQTMQELARDLLEEQGYSVLLAGSGIEAVEIFRERSEEIDLVILDLVMPKLDGGQTYLQLKSIDSSLRAFFCTGYMPNKVIAALLEEENLKAIQKPFDTGSFLALVRETIDRKRNGNNRR